MKVAIGAASCDKLYQGILLLLNCEYVSVDIDAKIADYIRYKLLNLRETFHTQEVYGGAEYALTATSTDYAHITDALDSLSVETPIRAVMTINSSWTIAIKSTLTDCAEYTFGLSDRENFCVVQLDDNSERLSQGGLSVH